MKKFVVSAGLAALGAAAIDSAMAESAVSPKYWNVSGTLRGFYDDNYNIAGNGKGSFGMELLPSIWLHVPFQQTDVGMRYTYGLYYYQDRNDIGVNAFDQTHQVDMWVDHAFNERWKAKLNDTFSVGQEPELLNPNPLTGVATPYRLNGDNLSNHGTLGLNTDWTHLFSTSLGYNNNFYDYQNHGAIAQFDAAGNPVIFNPTTGTFGASLAGLLNRVDQSISLDAKWHVLPDTTAFVGYQFAWVNYTGGEPIAMVSTLLYPNFIYHSSDRDSMSHYGYVGIEQQFTPNLTAAVRAGASYTDVSSDPLFPNTAWNPYADLSVSYTYLPGSYVQFGFTHDIGSTDQVRQDTSGHITQYSENSVVYVDVNHRITPKLIGILIGRVQYSTYHGGAASSTDQTAYSLGFNLNYQLTQHLSVDGGYNFDNVVTGIQGYQYTRNRVYLGLSANY